MVTLADSLQSSSARVLPVRVRRDLTARQHRYQGRVSWVVKEPLGLNYFRFQEEEYAILQMLDGTVSLDDIKHRFERTFPPQQISVEELQHFIGSLHRSGLITTDAPGQGKQLKKRRDERKRKELIGKLSNILWMRFRGIDPERILNFLLPFVRWMFTPVAVTLCLMFCLSALLLITVQFDVFQSKLPAFHQFFNLHNAFLLALALAVTKIIHEFGHGLSCKYFGGECHEMGIMLLALTPCLYCNVSDSWLLQNKWHRAAIGAAGMYIELIIASVCTYVWWFTEPGILNHLCLSTMFVSSVSTLVFNANPLLRYDGYYILSDIVEIPNLRQKSSDILNRTLGWWCLGLEPPEDPFLPERNRVFFGIYAVASAVYRWVVVFSIMFFIYKVFEPYRLEVIGQMIGMMSLYGLFIMPLWKLAKFFWVPGRIHKVKKLRLLASLMVVAAAVAGVALIPIPYYVISPMEVQPLHAASIYVSEPGQLEEVYVVPGQKVETNEQLAMLSSIDVELEIAELLKQQANYESQLETLKHSRFQERELGFQIPQVEESLTAIQRQLEKKRADKQNLTLVAPHAGTVMPPTDVPEQETNGQLRSWAGSPLDKKNLGCFLEQSSLFCMVGNPTAMQAVLVIDQSEVEFVRPGQEVDLKLDELPLETFQGTIEEVASLDLAISPRSLSNKSGGELATETDASGVERPQSTSYQARVPLDDTDHIFRIGLKGRAKIHVGSLTLGQRLVRWAKQTFHFRL